MSHPYIDVAEFHSKFELPTAKGARPALLEDLGIYDRARLAAATDLVRHARDLLRGREHPEVYRAAFALEETTEYLNAIVDRDLPAIADALVDKVYVDLGTAHFYGLPFFALWEEVQNANMAKERGPTSARGHGLDVRKPPGWEPPRIEAVLKNHGWKEGT